MDQKSNGPDKDWLDGKEVAAYLGISPPQLRALIRRGEWPPGTDYGSKTRRWKKEIVMAAALLRSVGFPRPRRRKKKTPKGGNAQE